jgi:hypothetical protein
VSKSATPKEFLVNITGQIMLARSLGIVADLGVADIVADGPKSMEELSEATGCDRDSLYRLLRMLGGHGVFAEDKQGRIKLTPRAELLQADHPDSVREMFVLGWQDIQWNTYYALPEAILTGEIAFENAHGKGFFDYLAEHPELNAMFDRRMAVVSHAENEQVANVYDFADHASVIDIGGGLGGLLAAIIERHPNVVAALYDQPQVLADPVNLREAGLLDTVARIAGDFFYNVPTGFGLYVMKRIIHDWDDDRAVGILRSCRDAMAETSRVLVIDAVMKPGNEPDPNKNLDLTIMALTPGRERTEDEFAALFAAAGLRLTRVIPTKSPSTLSLVEGERAS